MPIQTPPNPKPLRIGSETQIYGIVNDTVVPIEGRNTPSVIIDTNFHPSPNIYAAYVNSDKPILASQFLTVSSDKTLSDESGLALGVQPNKRYDDGSVSPGYTYINTTYINLVGEIYLSTVSDGQPVPMGNALLSTDSEGKVTPASSGDIFEGAGFISNTPTWPIEERDAPTPTVSTIQE